MSKRSSGPAAGGDVPLFTDLERVRSAAASFGFHHLEGEQRLVFPWNNHVLIVRIDEDSPASLLFESELRQKLAFSEITATAQSINRWNHERLGPTASLRVNDDGEVEVHSRTAALIDEGLSDEQLSEHIRLGIETTILFVREILGEHPDLAAGAPGPDDAQDAEKQHSQQDLAAMMEHRAAEKRRSAEDNAMPMHAATETTGWTEQVDDHDFQGDAQIPAAVTVDRVREALGGLGITKTTGEDEALIAWINGVLFGFFIDNGPSYLIKGHWDPGLDPDGDFLRVFLLCNDWNEESLTTKAYTHTDDEGLQVRVEFTVAVSVGLNDAQLEHNTAVAINHILHALDTISTDATGVSAVEWPN